MAAQQETTFRNCLFPARLWRVEAEGSGTFEGVLDGSPKCL